MLELLILVEIGRLDFSQEFVQESMPVGVLDKRQHHGVLLCPAANCS